MIDYAQKLRQSRSHEQDVEIHLTWAEMIAEDGGSLVAAMKHVCDAVRAMRRHVERVPWRDREPREMADG